MSKLKHSLFFNRYTFFTIILVINCGIGALHLINCIHFYFYDKTNFNDEQMNALHSLIEIHFVQFLYFIKTGVVDAFLLIFNPKIWQFTANGILYFLNIFPIRYFFTWYSFIHYLDKIFPRKYTFKPYNYYVPRYPVVDSFTGNILYYSVIFLFLYFLTEVTQIIPITQALKRKKIEAKLLTHYDKDDELLKTYPWYPFVKYIFFALIIIAWTRASPIISLKTVNNDDYWLFYPYNNKNITKLLRKPLRISGFKITSIGMLIGEQGKTVNAFIQSDGDLFLTQHLIEVMDEREIAASVAHELGHYYNKDIYYFKFFWAIPVLVFIFILFSLFKNGLEEFGFEKEIPIVPAIFITFAFSESFFQIIRIASNILNRECEIRADCFAASFGLPIATAIQKLSADQERLDIRSSEIYHFFFRTHPSGRNRDDIFAHCPKFVTKIFD